MDVWTRISDCGQITVAHLLKRHNEAREQQEKFDPSSSGPSSRRRRGISIDPLWERARSDVQRMLQILLVPANAGDKTAKTRVEVLSSYL